MTITPAYGRDYKNKADLLKDWLDGKDFTLQHMASSTYINREGAEQAGLTSFQARYKELRSVAILKLGPKGWTI